MTPPATDRRSTPTTTCQTRKCWRFWPAVGWWRCESRDEPARPGAEVRGPGESGRSQSCEDHPRRQDAQPVGVDLYTCSMPTRAHLQPGVRPELPSPVEHSDATVRAFQRHGRFLSPVGTGPGPAHVPSRVWRRRRRRRSGAPSTCSKPVVAAPDNPRRSHHEDWSFLAGLVRGGSHPIDVNHVQPVEQVGIERAV